MKRLSILALAAILSACGGGDDGDTSSASALDKYVGDWKFEYAGPSPADCSMVITRSSSEVEAPMKATCKSTRPGISFGTVFWGVGAVDTNGNVSSVSMEGDFLLSGSMTGSTGVGTWRNIPGATGTWRASR